MRKREREKKKYDTQRERERYAIRGEDRERNVVKITVFY